MKTINQETIDQINQLNQNGTRLIDACKNVGISVGRYYGFKRKCAKEKKVRKPYTRRNVTLTEIPVASGARLEVLLNGKDITEVFLSKFLGTL